MAAGAATRSRRSDRRIPGHRDFAVARSVLLDIGERREWVVETLQQHLFRHQHVVDLAAGFLLPHLNLVVEKVAAGILAEHVTHDGHVTLLYAHDYHQSRHLGNVDVRTIKWGAHPGVG